MSNKAKMLLKFFLVSCMCMAAKVIGRPDKAQKQLIEAEKIRNNFKNLYPDDTANIGVMDAVLTVVTGAVVMGVGAMILAKIQPNVVGSDDSSNTTIAAIFSTAWDALGLLPVALIVIAAVVIIGVVLLLGRASN